MAILATSTGWLIACTVLSKTEKVATIETKDTKDILEIKMSEKTRKVFEGTNAVKKAEEWALGVSQPSKKRQ